jgi:hypothetical protein
MDAKRFEEVATALLNSLGDRLSAPDQDWFRSYLWSGEDGLLADELAAALSQDRVPIDAAERDLLSQLLHYFDLEQTSLKKFRNIQERDRVVASLNIVDA